MNYLRWYDKDPVIKEFMSALERLDEETINLLAQDFIQTMMEDEFINTDGAIKSLIQNIPPGYNRCLEVLKSLPQEHQRRIISKFRESMYQLIATLYYGTENEEQKQ